MRRTAATAANATAKEEIGMKYLLGAILLVTLVGCQGRSKEQIVFDTWASACEAYASALITLAPSVADGTMSDEGVATIDDATMLVGPNCRDGVPVSNDVSLTQQIQEILLKLQGLE